MPPHRDCSPARWSPDPASPEPRSRRGSRRDARRRRPAPLHPGLRRRGSRRAPRGRSPRPGRRDRRRPSAGTPRGSPAARRTWDGPAGRRRGGRRDEPRIESRGEAVIRPVRFAGRSLAGRRRFPARSRRWPSGRTRARGGPGSDRRPGRAADRRRPIPPQDPGTAPRPLAPGRRSSRRARRIRDRSADSFSAPPHRRATRPGHPSPPSGATSARAAGYGHAPALRGPDRGGPVVRSPRRSGRLRYRCGRHRTRRRSRRPRFRSANSDAR